MAENTVVENVPESELFCFFLLNFCAVLDLRLLLIYLRFLCRWYLFYVSLDCPGVESKQAGKSSACAGCPNQTLCASGKASGPDPGTFL